MRALLKAAKAEPFRSRIHFIASALRSECRPDGFVLACHGLVGFSGKALNDRTQDIIMAFCHDDPVPSESDWRHLCEEHGCWLSVQFDGDGSEL